MTSSSAETRRRGCRRRPPHSICTSCLGLMFCLSLFIISSCNPVTAFLLPHGDTFYRNDVLFRRRYSDSRQKILLRSNNSEEDEPETARQSSPHSPLSFFEFPEIIIMEDPSLIIVDLFAIAIACQLLGLLDAVNDPVWIAKGGWAQPLEAPKTLGVLVQRFSTISVAWISVGMILDGYSSKAVEYQSVNLRTLFRIWISFVVAMLAFDVGSYELLHQQNLHLAQVARQSYFVGLAIPAFRFLYGQYFR